MINDSLDISNLRCCTTSLLHILDQSDNTISCLLPLNFLSFQQCLAVFSLYPSQILLPYPKEVKQIYITFHLCVSHYSDTNVREG